MSRSKLNLGLFGFGCVGYGLYQVLQKTPNLNAKIKKICVKNSSKTRPINKENFIYDKNEILNDDTIDTIVELIDDAEEAYYIVKQAIIRGKSVVTANKKMLAEHLEELIYLQRKYNVSLLYEAACCASIPIIRNLEEYYDNDLLEKIEGIVNGSTNYILTNTFEKGLDFQDALKDAQSKGYAESDPSLDVGGFDAKYKLIILIVHAFGLIIKPENCFHLGIDRLGELELNYAKEKGYKIKLIAYAEKVNDKTIQAYVIPKFVAKTNNLYSVDDVYNGVKTSSYFSENQFFVGKGAGAFSTGSAVISDISALSYQYKYEYKKLNNQLKIENEKCEIKVFIAYKNQYDKFIKLNCNKIYETYQNTSHSFLIGKISLNRLKIITRESQNISILGID